MEPIESIDNNRKTADAKFKAGMAHLKGLGVTKDEGLAAANLLDSSDYDHPFGTLACALLYFTGVGVTRNLENSSMYAHKFCEIASDQAFIKIANDIADGSYGTQNALKLLYGLDSNNPSDALPNQGFVKLTADIKSKGNLKVYISAGVLIFLIAVTAMWALTPKVGALPAISGPDPKTIFSSEEISDAKKRANELAGVFRTEARTAAQKNN